MTELWTVRQNTGPQGKTDTFAGRVVFEGIERDARTFVENNFPRVHVSGQGEELKADVHLVSPDGVEYRYFGPEHSEPWESLDKPDDTLSGEQVEPE